MEILNIINAMEILNIIYAMEILNIIYACIYPALFLLAMLILCLAAWNGFKFEIGNDENGFHLLFQVHPLKRFFKIKS
jgi:hypothetical protein